MSKEEMSKKKGKGKIIIAVLVVLFVLGAAFGSKGGNKDKATNAGETEQVKDKADDKKTDSKSAEPNTSARVDEITLQAKDDAESVSEDESEQKWEEAFEYLKSHMDNFYENNEVMEKSMYYGSYIYHYVEANSKASDASELVDSSKAAYEAGYNTVKAIKYVYRGAEAVEDESTQKALSEAKENLKKFK